ncbi:MAG: Zn-ribbon domain-containing OB-fold protein [Actinomycetota bacterium]
MTHTLTELVAGSTPIVVEESRGYWEGTLAEELRVQACNACGNRQLPWGPCCTRCLSQDLTWLRSAGRGTVFSFTIVRQAIHPTFSAQVPYVIADVELDEGPIMTSNVTGCPPEDVRIGMPVELWFDAEAEDAFHTKLRLPKFRPTED